VGCEHRVMILTVCSTTTYKYFLIWSSQVSETSLQFLMALSPTCPSDKKSFKLEATLEHRWNITERRQVPGEKPVPVLHCLPQISLGLTPRSNPDLCVERPAPKYCTRIQFIRNSQKTFCITNTNHNRTEVIIIYCENHWKPIHTLCGQNAMVSEC